MSKKYRYRRRKYGFFIILCLIAALMGMQTPAAEGKNGKRVLRVAFTETPGLSETDEIGNRSGIIVDFLNEIAKYTGWEYEYIDVDGTDIVNKFIEKQFDLMGGTYWTTTMEEYALYPGVSCGSSRAVLFCRPYDTRMKSYDMKSLNGCTIGVYEAAHEKIRRLNEFLKINDLDCIVRPYTSDELSEDGNLYHHLENGEVDLLLGNDMEDCPQFRIVTSFEAQEHYIVTPVGNEEILEELNMALGYIVDSDPNFAEEAYNAHFQKSRENEIMLSQEEQDYIKETKVLTVAAMDSWHPFYCEMDINDHHNGIIPDLLEQISRITGLSFELVYAENYQDALELVSEGKVDILGCFMDTEERASDLGLAETKTFVNLNSIVVKNKAANYPGKGLTCAILMGSELPAEIEADRVVKYPNVYEAVIAVNKGECDFAYGTAATIEQVLQSHHFANVMAVSAVNHSTDVTFAVPKPVKPELLTVLNKAINSISADEKNTILDRNLVSIAPSSMNVQDMIYANPIAFIVVCGLILVLIVIIYVMATQSRIKNLLMENELKKAEAENKARGEFLSRMSHEIRTPMNAIVGLTDLVCRQEDASPAVRKNLEKIRSSSDYLLSLINDILDMSRIENEMLTVIEEDFSITDMAEELVSMIQTMAEQKKLIFEHRIQADHDWLLGDPLRLRQILLNLLSNSIKFTPEGGRVELDIFQEEIRDGKICFRFSVKDTGVGIAPEYQEQVFTAFKQLGANISKSQGTGLGLPISQKLVSLMGGELKLISAPGQGSEFYFTLCLPMGVPKEREGRRAQEGSLEGARILLAEDNDLNAEIVVELLQLKGMITERAANGQEAVDLFMMRGPGYYQAVLMDIQMPVKGGLEAARDLRGSGREDAGRIPIIAMTANTFKEDVEATKAAGMDAFIAKPVDSDLLFELLGESILLGKGKRKDEVSADH